MKKISTITLSLLTGAALVSGAFAANETAKAPAQSETKPAQAAPADNSANASYTIGYSIGKNMTEQLKQQDVTFSTDKLVSGFSAGVNGEKPKLTQKEMESAMQTFQTQMKAKMKAHEAQLQATQEQAKKAANDATAKPTTTDAKAADSTTKDAATTAAQ